MSKKDLNLLQGELAGLADLSITEAEAHGTITHSASVLSKEDDTIVPGLNSAGPRVINYADILKYNYIPLASTLRKVLDIITEATGNPSEIEFAIDLTKDSDGNASFYLLQIKPLVGSGAGYNIDPESINQDELILETSKSMGNGIIEDVSDIVYVEPESFDRLKTIQIAAEIEKINESMLRENRKYVLIGPGRWGSKDRFIGIPVVWTQISNAKVIVELGLPGFHLDASLGSHFFHNVTSMRVGYFSINNVSHSGQIVWDKIKSQTEVTKGEFCRQIRFDKPLAIRMDGKKGIAVITMNK